MAGCQRQANRSEPGVYARPSSGPSCMKMNEKFCLYFLAESHTKLIRKTRNRFVLMDDNHLISFIFTLETTRRAGGVHLARD
jgi:hypothetical protein